MKWAVSLILACCGIAISIDAIALEDYIGFSADAVKSSGNGVNHTAAGLTGLISARPSRYYGYEEQIGVLGKVGPYSSNAEVDFALAGFLPFGGSGLDLYGKAGAVAAYSSGNVFNTGYTYGAGVEYLYSKGVIRLGLQHFNVGKSPSLATKLVGIAFLFKL